MQTDGEGGEGVQKGRYAVSVGGKAELRVVGSVKASQNTRPEHGVDDITHAGHCQF